jgi:hypothetical protein
MTTAANTAAKSESATPVVEKPGLFSRVGSSLTDFQTNVTVANPFLGTAAGVALYSGVAAVAAPLAKKAISGAQSLFGRGAKTAVEEASKEAAQEQAANFASGGGSILGLFGRK